MSQRDFWRGEFGNSYIERNESQELISSNIVLFSEIFRRSKIFPTSILEIGANIGLNLSAIRQLFPDCKMSGVEINEKAANLLEKTGAEVIRGSIEEVTLVAKYDLVFTKGVLIHIDPDSLKQTYDKIFNSTTRWVLLIEYYSRTPTETVYRGHQGVLFKRDFAGEFLDQFCDKVHLIDYGFVYHRDKFPQDDLTWFLLEKI